MRRQRGIDWKYGLNEHAQGDEKVLEQAGANKIFVALYTEKKCCGKKVYHDIKFCYFGIYGVMVGIII